LFILLVEIWGLCVSPGGCGFRVRLAHKNEGIRPGGLEGAKKIENFSEFIKLLIYSDFIEWMREKNPPWPGAADRSRRFSAFRGAGSAAAPMRTALGVAAPATAVFFIEGMGRTAAMHIEGRAGLRIERFVVLPAG